MNEYGELHIHLGELLQKAGMSKRQFADAAKMQRSQINHFWNNEVTRLDTDGRCRMCRALNGIIGD